MDKKLEIIVRNSILGDSKIKAEKVSNTNYKLDINHELYFQAWISSHDIDYGKRMSKSYHSIKGDISIDIYDKNKNIYSFDFNDGNLTSIKTTNEMELVKLEEFQIKNALFYGLKIVGDISENEKFKFKFTKNLLRILNKDIDEHFYSKSKSAFNFRNRNGIISNSNPELEVNYTY